MNDYGLKPGDKVRYRTIGAGDILGVVVSNDYDGFYAAYYATVRVTSRRNPTYPVGYKLYAPASVLVRR